MVGKKCSHHHFSMCMHVKPKGRERSSKTHTEKSERMQSMKSRSCSGSGLQSQQQLKAGLCHIIFTNTMHRRLSPSSVLRKLLLRWFFATKSLCDIWAVIIWWMHSERFSCAQAASSSKPQRACRVSENTRSRKTQLQASSERAQVSLQAPEFNCPYS